VFRQLGEMMKSATSLIVFPEGTRSPDGRVRRFRTGIFRLAIESGYTIVPVAVRGTRPVMPKGRLMTCPGDVWMEVFDPIPTGGMAVEEARGLASRVQQIVSEGVPRLPEDPRERLLPKGPAAGRDE
jgi:1-acyl-sn-glycerol-3-phosphate acyltransferase